MKKKRTAALITPDELKKAADAAPAIFSVSAYFQSLYVMRQKGYSWRYLAKWLAGYQINISHVQLHRLYSAEDVRLDKLTRNELLKLGMPREMVEQRLSKDDPNKRLIAPDPSEDEEIQ